MNYGSIRIIPARQHPGWVVNIKLAGELTPQRVSREVKLETSFRNLEVRNNLETFQKSEFEKRAQ